MTCYFALRINLGNDVPGDLEAWDVAHMLRTVADRIAVHGELPAHPGHKIRDAFGNTVGSFGTVEVPR